MLARTLSIIAVWLLLLSASPELLYAFGSQDPERIISTAPSITEMIFALDAGDRLVGRTSYCDHPPEASEISVIGDFASPNVETVLDLNPDLLILYSDRGDLVRKFRPFGIPMLILEHESLEQIFASIEELGTKIGREDFARQLTDQLKEQLQHLAGTPRGGSAPSVLFLVSRNPGALTEMYVAGATSYIGQLVELAGGRNAFGDLQSAYPKISIEQILARDPEWIIDMSHGDGVSDRDVQEIVALWSNFGTLHAVEENQVHVARSDVFIRPGPRVVEAVQRLIRIIHEDR